MFDNTMRDTMELDKKELRPSEDHAIENAIEELKKRHGATEASEAASVTADHMLELARKKEAVKAAAIEEAKSVVAKAAQAQTATLAEEGSVEELHAQIQRRPADVVQPQTPDLVEILPEKAEEKAEAEETYAKAGQPEEQAAEAEAAAEEAPAETEAEPVQEAEAEEAPAEAEAELPEEPAEEPVEEPVEEPAAEASVAEATPEEKTPSGRPNLLKFGLNPVLPYSMEEAINRLRINISFLGNDVKKIMIVSSEPNEGKSFVAMILWKQMAVSGEPSILLDLDMRKSTMAVKYQLEREDGKELLGTTHFLSGNVPIEDMISHTELEHGDILPNVDNIVNPSMLLESRKFGEMMKYMENHYRYVFVDVPPLGLVSDGELIGSVCDGAVLCVRGGVTSRGIVRRSIQQLERAGCQVLGIVLNRVGGSGSGYYHKYYGKKYYYNDQYYSGKK